MGGIIEVAVAIAVSVGTAAGAAAATAAIVGAAIIAAGIGTVLGVVGTLTHNKILSDIGLGLSIAGVITGFSAAAGLFTGTAEALETVDAVGTLAGEAPTVLEGAAGAGLEVNPITDPALGLSGAEDIASGAAIGPGAEFFPDAGEPIFDTPDYFNMEPAEGTSGELAGGAGTDTLTEGAAAGTEGATTPVTAAEAPAATPSPDAGMINAGQTLGPGGAAGTGNSAVDAAIAQAKNISTGNLSTWWTSLDPATRGAIIMTAGQTAAGAAKGLFAGMQADKQLAFQKLIDQENRAQFQTIRSTTPGVLSFAGQMGNPPRPA